MAWKWIHISLNSQIMIVLLVLVQKLNFHEFIFDMVSLIIRYWNIHIPSFLGSSGINFFQTEFFFCITLISICISITRCQYFISSHPWMSMTCCWNSIVQCDTALLKQSSQSFASFKRRCILADGIIIFHHYLLQYLLVMLLLTLIKLTSNSFHMSYSHPNNWHEIKLSYQLAHMNLYNQHTLYQLLLIKLFIQAHTYKFVQSSATVQVGTYQYV